MFVVLLCSVFQLMFDGLKDCICIQLDTHELEDCSNTWKDMTHLACT